MALFFLDVVTADNRFEDPDGGEHENLNLAQAEARLAIRELVANDIREGRRIGLDRRIDIRDGDGNIVANIDFSDVVPL